MMATRNNTASAAPNNKVKNSRLVTVMKATLIYSTLQGDCPGSVPISGWLFVGSLLLAGYINVMYPDRTIPVLIIGILIFLPGFYHLRIAYYVSKSYRGYSYDDIPDFDD